ncbi:MAG: TIGR04282 family arsenosugar biosynthesis glycosyltransferase [Magnetococcales bacterium]|nr:TIGR04282 family arsenosugar biosynthesis glycosyltransferase [Magnetococcales bacterium]
MVKTRLIPALGVSGATRAHEQLLAHVIRVARTWVQAQSGRHLLLWCTPDHLHPFFDDLLPVDQRRLQPEGDLGVRLDHIAASQINQGQGVLLLGGDAASVSTILLDATQAALLHRDAVMAPAQDGGYILLALNRYHPSLFQNISWGTAAVAAETRDRLTALDWRWHELPMQWDVDRPADWQRFLRL